MSSESASAFSANLQNLLVRTFTVVIRDAAANSREALAVKFVRAAAFRYHAGRLQMIGWAGEVVQEFAQSTVQSVHADGSGPYGILDSSPDDPEYTGPECYP